MRTASGYIFRPSEAEPNLWHILLVKESATSQEEQEVGGTLFGLILIYVDDMLILSIELIVTEVIATLQQEWDTSKPEWIGKTSVRFLGMEISLHDGNYMANQKNYIVDKLEGMEMTGQRTTAPVVKDMNPQKEENIHPEEVRSAQKAMGELLWLSTRTRPDISFIVAKCSQQILAAPRWVVTTSSVVWEYLRGTAAQGLWFIKEKGMSWEEGSPAGLETYSDISYSPDGEISHGAVYVTWNKSLMWWRSGRQPFPTMSTAESELVEAVEAFCIGDSIDTLIAEHEEPHAKRLLVDNAAAVSLLQDGSTSWRTRHLKIRTKNLRWRISSLDWKVNYIPGLYQVADAGTKPLSAQRLNVLKGLMNMGSPAEDQEDVETKQKPSATGGQTTEGVKAALLVAMLAAQLQRVKGEDQEEGDSTEGANFVTLIVGLYTLAVAILVLVGKWICQRAIREAMNCFRSRSAGSRSVDERGSGMRTDTSSSAQEGSLRFRGAMQQRGVDGRGASRSEEEPEPSPPFSPASPVLAGPDGNGNRMPEPFNVFGPRVDQPGQRAEDPQEPAREGREAEEVPVPPLLVYVAPKSGKRYHVKSRCQGLLTASGVRSDILCRDCLDGEIGVRPLFGYPGGLKHVSKAHAEATAPNMWIPIDEFKRCMRCRD